MDVHSSEIPATSHKCYVSFLYSTLWCPNVAKYSLKKFSEWLFITTGNRMWNHGQTKTADAGCTQPKAWGNFRALTLTVSSQLKTSTAAFRRSHQGIVFLCLMSWALCVWFHSPPPIESLPYRLHRIMFYFPQEQHFRVIAPPQTFATLYQFILATNFYPEASGHSWVETSF